MKRIISLVCMAIMVASCAQNNGTPKSNVNPDLVADAPEGAVVRMEPRCWWVGMNTDLQIMVYGPAISEYDVCIAGAEGVSITSVDKADSPNYLFVNVSIAPEAAAGEYYLVFTAADGSQFKCPYTIGARKKGSAQRGSFTTDDAIYLLMPDRFSNGDPSNDNTPNTLDKANPKAFFGRYGGDMKGIENHLDYIADLGMTAIWCTPLLEDNQPRGSYHGYACTDYYGIDPRFGSNEDYAALVAKAHSKGLKMVMDMVPNHCGSAHWWMQDLPFADWVHVWPEYTGSNCCFSMQNDPYASQFDAERMYGGWFDKSMPDMNLDNPYVLQYFKQWAVWWIEYADLDGLRVDTFPYNEKEPVSQWCKAILDEYPHMNIVGEVWSENVPQVAYWQKGNNNKDGYDSNLPSIMDFPLQGALCKAFNEDKVNWDEGMVRIYNSVANDLYYADPDNKMLFPGNHDTEHISDIIGQHEGKWRCIMALMATLRGYPQIFSGDEIMQVSKDLTQGHGGLRQMLPDNWASDAKMKRCHDYFSALFNFRKNSEALRHGKVLHFLRRDNTYALFRYTGDEAVFVFINNTASEYAVPWGDYQEISVNLCDEGVDVVSGETLDMRNAVVPAHSPLVVKLNYKK